MVTVMAISISSTRGLVIHLVMRHDSLPMVMVNRQRTSLFSVMNITNRYALPSRKVMVKLGT